MNDQDRDLIAALAEGRLGTDAAEAATARIEADPELTAEYTDQVAALEFLGSGTAPRMTVAERTTLHENLTEQLGLVPTPTRAPARRRTPWWAPVFGLATAAAVVVAVVIFPGSSSDQFAEVSADGARDTATVSETTAAAGEAAEAPASEDQSLMDDGGISVYETGAVELDELLNEAEGADSADEIQGRLFSLNFKTTVNLDSEEIKACIDELVNEIPPGVETILVIGADIEDEATIVHLGFDHGDGIEDGLSFVLGDCSLVRHANQG